MYWRRHGGLCQSERSLLRESVLDEHIVHRQGHVRSATHNRPQALLLSCSPALIVYQLVSVVLCIASISPENLVQAHHKLSFDQGCEKGSLCRQASWPFRHSFAAARDFLAPVHARHQLAQLRSLTLTPARPRDSPESSLERTPVGLQITSSQRRARICTSDAASACTIQQH